MGRYVLVLPDGTHVVSGIPGQDALCRIQLTRSVADAAGEALGACCAAMLEAEIFYYGEPPVSQGDMVQLYELEGGNLQLLGQFYAEEPKLSGANRMTLTAYDGISRLDRDLTDWLAALQPWPETAWDLAEEVCEACGLILEESPVLNGDYPVPVFTAQVTGRKLMRWLGQIFGRYLIAQPQGTLRFAWFRDNPQVRIGPVSTRGREDLESRWEAGVLTLFVPSQWEEADLTLQTRAEETAGNLTLYQYDWQQHPYTLDSLQLSGYTTAPVQRVCIRAKADDVGVAWPGEAEGAALQILGNPMLRADSADAILPVAQRLYEQLAGFSYAPCQVTLAQWGDIAPGDRILVTDHKGNSVSTLVMTHHTDRGQLKIESRGASSPESTAAVNAVSLGTLAGKVMGMRLDIDGLRLENSQADAALTKLNLTVDGIHAQVENQKNTLQGVDSRMADLRLDAQGLQLKLDRIQSEGVSRVSTSTGYTFDERGLLISKDGQTMENLLDNTGMYVRRAGQTILQANDAGVKAVDVQVKNYLILGSHSRLEDYATTQDPNRTACFYIDKEAL